MSCTDVSSADRVDGEILEVGMAGAMSQHRSVKSRVDHKLHLRRHTAGDATGDRRNSRMSY